jgi:hypothetical protein
LQSGLGDLNSFPYIELVNIRILVQ